MKIAIPAGVGLALAASATFMAPQTAVAQANDEVQLCRSLVAAQLFSSVGDCVSSLRNRPVAFCKDPAVLQFFGFKNRGECISLFRPEF